jgi:hypothetical protein
MLRPGAMGTADTFRLVGGMPDNPASAEEPLRHMMVATAQLYIDDICCIAAALLVASSCMIH